MFCFLTYLLYVYLYKTPRFHTEIYFFLHRQQRQEDAHRIAKETANYLKQLGSIESGTPQEQVGCATETDVQISGHFAIAIE